MPDLDTRKNIVQRPHRRLRLTLDAAVHEQGVHHTHQPAVETILEGAHELAAVLDRHALVGQQQLQAMITTRTGLPTLGGLIVEHVPAQMPGTATGMDVLFESLARKQCTLATIDTQ